MDFCAEIRRLRQSASESALAIARDLEAGRAVAPFQEKLTQLAATPVLPVRAAVVAAHPEALHPLLSEIIGQDYNVCKVVVPSRLGFSEVMLQERGFLLDTGAGAKEFDDAGSFLNALQETHALQQEQSNEALEPLRLKLKGPAHVNGLCLLVPHSLDALVRKPALLSTLADQADWVFLAGTPSTDFSAEQRAAIQLVLDQVTGLQSVQHTPTEAESAPAPAAGSAPPEAWWKGWKVGLSLGLVRLGTDLLRKRLAMLTEPASELRLYLVESRLLRQLEMTFALMDEEVQQAQRQINNRLNLSREGLVGPAASGDLRKAAEPIRSRLSEEYESITRALERDAKAALALDGAINRRLRDAAQGVTADDIEQTTADTAIKLTLADATRDHLTSQVLQLARERTQQEYQQLQEGFECSVRDAERALEKATGVRHKLSFELPDHAQIWESVSAIARPEIRYRGEMPRPTFMSRLSSARQGIMSIMILGTVLGGAAAFTGEQGGSQAIRTTLYGLMLPLMVIGFLWTYVSFRKKEALLLEKEVEKLQDGILNEIRRVWQELQREHQGALNSAFQKNLKSLHQQIDGAMERLERQRQQEADEARRRGQDQQRSMEQRQQRLRQFSGEIATLQRRLDDARRVRTQWLADWINRFNQGKV